MHTCGEVHWSSVASCLFQLERIYLYGKMGNSVMAFAKVAPNEALVGCKLARKHLVGKIIFLVVVWANVELPVGRTVVFWWCWDYCLRTIEASLLYQLVSMGRITKSKWRYNNNALLNSMKPTALLRRLYKTKMLRRATIGGPFRTYCGSDLVWETSVNVHFKISLSNLC